MTGKRQVRNVVDVELPVLYGQDELYEPGSEVRSEKVTIDRQMTRSIMLTRLKAYNRPCPANTPRDELIGALLAYSADKSQWQSQFAAAIPSRGKQRRVRKSGPLARRMEQKAGAAPDDPTHRSMAGALYDKRTERDIDEMHEIAQKVLNLHRAREEAKRGNNAEGAGAEKSTPGDSGVDGGGQALAKQSDVHALRQGMADISSKMDVLTHAFAHTAVARAKATATSSPTTTAPDGVALANAPKPTLRPTPPTPTCGGVSALADLLKQLEIAHGAGHAEADVAAGSSPNAPIQVSPDTLAALTGLLSVLQQGFGMPPGTATAPPKPVPTEAAFKETTVLDFGGGDMLEFNPSTDVRRRLPPNHSYKDLDGYRRLFSQWHDTDPATALIVIRDRGIPMRLWDQLFKERSGVAFEGTWKSYKSSWHNWKFLVLDYEAKPSFQAWVASHTVDGRMRNFSKIVKSLKARRAEKTEDDVAAAHAYFADKGGLYGQRAGATFKYRKGKDVFDGTKDAFIAKQWQALLLTDDDVAQWARDREPDT